MKHIGLAMKIIQENLDFIFREINKKEGGGRDAGIAQRNKRN